MTSCCWSRRCRFTMRSTPGARPHATKHIRGRRKSRHSEHSLADLLRRGIPPVDEDRLAQFRRAGRADRAHASRAGRAPALDQRSAIPACAQLLHAAARPGGAAARDLHRLAPAPYVGRHRCRRLVRAAGHARDAGPELALRSLLCAGTGGGAVLRPQSCGARGRDRSRAAHRPSRVEEPLHGGARRRGLPGDLFLQSAVSLDRRGRGAARARRTTNRASVLRTGVARELPRRGEFCRRSNVRGRSAGACAPRHATCIDAHCRMYSDLDDARRSRCSLARRTARLDARGCDLRPNGCCDVRRCVRRARLHRPARRSRSCSGCGLGR